jgi:uncharacterized protein (DUF885 family)
MTSWPSPISYDFKIAAVASPIAYFDAVKYTRLITLILGFAALLAGVVWTAKLIWFRPFNIDHFFERAYIEFLWDDPEALRSTGILNKYGLSAPSSTLLTDVSPKRTEALAEMGQRNLRLLEGYDRSKLSINQQVSYDVFHWFLKTGVAGEPFLFHDYPVSHLSGPHVELPQFMTVVHPIETLQDAKDYLLRLEQFGVKFGQTIDALSYRKEKGVVAPTYILTKAIVICDDFVRSAPEENPLYTSFDKRLQKLEGMDPKVKDELLSKCRLDIIEHVYPAYKRLSGFLMQLENESLAIAGVWHVPNGDAYYRHCLLQHTTLAVDPDTLFAFGRLEMSRIEGEMRILLNMLHHPSDVPVNKLMRQMAEDRSITFGNDSAGRSACLLHFRRTIDQIQPLLVTHFSRLPQTILEVHELPEYRATSSPLAFYLTPKGEPPGPGRMFVNTWKAEQLTYFMATTYAFHEGLPGHHLQKAIQIEMSDQPQFRKFIPFTAFAEGWAMYAEELGHEMMMSEDPLDRLALLQSDLFRTARMMADIGIHRKKWLRDQAVQFLMDNASLSMSDAQDEVDRYSVWPGHGCAYKVGKMKFLQLRNKVQKAKGADFDIKEFHDLMIGQGAMPLAMLESRVDDYLNNSVD